MILLFIALTSSSHAIDSGHATVEAKSSKSKNKNNKNKKNKEPTTGWETKTSFTPTAGIVSYSNGDTTENAVSVGGNGMLQYKQRGGGDALLSGKARLQATYIMGTSGTTGQEVRLGNFIGPDLGDLRVELGQDLFWNQTTIAGVPELSPTTGFELPLTTTLASKDAELWVGAAPAWVTNESRRVDWDDVDVFGFGHEFTYSAGVGATIAGTFSSVSYSYKITSAGVQQGFSVGASL